jgi:hypothetical protein
VRNGGPYAALDLNVIAKHRQCIEQTHGATLEAINAAGGLDWIELWCALHDRPVWPLPPISTDDARAAVLAAVTAALAPKK